MQICWGRIIKENSSGPKSVMCGLPVWKCTKCKMAGCNRYGCPNQKFENNRCMICGNIGTKAV